MRARGKRGVGSTLQRTHNNAALNAAVHLVKEPHHNPGLVLQEPEDEVDRLRHHFLNLEEGFEAAGGRAEVRGAAGARRRRSRPGAGEARSARGRG